MLKDNAVLPGYEGTFFKFANKNLGQVISALLPYIYVAAGLALLVMLIMGGIQLMTAAGDPAKTKASYGRLTFALIGFLVIFISYFVAQLLEVILGIKFL